MAAKTRKVSVKSKVWLEDRQGRIIFGLGRMRILSAIEKCGSLNSAAKDLKMSYRAVWGKIKVTEEALGKPLLVKSQGGSAGGGSTASPLMPTPSWSDTWPSPASSTPRPMIFSNPDSLIRSSHTPS